MDGLAMAELIMDSIQLPTLQAVLIMLPSQGQKAKSCISKHYLIISAVYTVDTIVEL